MQEVSKYGYHCECVVVSHFIWVNNSWERVWLFGVHEDAGGKAAVIDIKNMFLACVAEIEKLNTIANVHGEATDGLLEQRVLSRASSFGRTARPLPGLTVRLAHETSRTDVWTDRAAHALPVVQEAKAWLAARRISTERRVVREHVIALVLKVEHEEALGHQLALPQLQHLIVHAENRSVCLFLFARQSLSDT